MTTEIDSTCALCGHEDTHHCGDDFLCDRCCTNIMAIPDELPKLFEWLDSVVVPHVVKIKQKKANDNTTQ